MHVALLRKTLEHITAHPEEWAQNDWAVRTPACGTRYCLAGTAVMLTGQYKIDWSTGTRVQGVDEYRDAVRAIDCVNVATGRTYDISTEAERLLGLDDGWLFAGHHSLRTLWQLASDMTDGEIEVPEEDLPDVTAS